MGSLFRNGGGGATPLVALTPATAPSAGASLFAGRNGLLKPLPPRVFGGFARRGVTGATAAVLDLIAEAEAGPNGYDAVHYGATVKPPEPPSRLTLGDIYAWIDDTPGQPHAIGRYQFIPATLKRLARVLGLPPTARFSPALQDRMAERLLMEAGLDDFNSGEIERGTFMNNIARVWAGLPNANGRSHYHGYAGNKATISRARFEREMKRIFGG